MSLPKNKFNFPPNTQDPCPTCGKFLSWKAAGFNGKERTLVCYNGCQTVLGTTPTKAPVRFGAAKVKSGAVDPYAWDFKEVEEERKDGGEDMRGENYDG